MGVKKLPKSLEEIYKELDKKEPIRYNIPVKSLENKSVAIDASLWMYQGKCAILGTSGGIQNKEGTDISVIVAILNRILYLLKSGIKPIFIFDGKPPQFKTKILKQRKDNKDKAKEKLKNENYSSIIEKNKLQQRVCNLTKSDISLFKELLSLLGIPYINSPGEADSQCAFLFKNKIVNFIISDDSDIMVFGGNKIIKEFKSSAKTVEVFDLDVFYKNTGFQQNDIIDIALLLGCDYYEGVKGIGIKRIIKTIHNKETLFPDEKKDKTVMEIIDYFINPEVQTKILNSEKTLGKINFDKLNYYFQNTLDFTPDKILSINKSLI